jgi:mono/diheme cytochrome c family protein
MPYGFRNDEDLDRSTNAVMKWGLILMVGLVLVFPFYRWFEPANREAARELHLTSLAQQGSQIWSLNCASCHGLNGEGGVGPALNSQQFLQSATDEQTILLVSVGIPGTLMSAYALDHGGPLTSEQIRAVAIYMRSWEETAPDRPDWRDTPLG